MKYNKSEIVNLAEEKGGLHFDPRTLLNRLDRIIELLNSERAKTVMDWDEEGKIGDYFLNKEMSINTTREDHGKQEYKYEIKTAIILSILLILYEDKYLEALMAGKYANMKDGEEFIKKAEIVIKGYRKYWNEEWKKAESKNSNKKPVENRKSWDVVEINIMSQIYKLTLLAINREDINNIEESVKNPLEKFMALDDDLKNETYKKIKTRLEYINKQIDEVIANMDPAEKYEYETNFEYNRKSRNNRR